MMKNLDPFPFTDYRSYLREWLALARLRRGFSLRVFAERAGLGSQSHLKMVIDGKRNLGESGIERFMNGLGLGGEERLYFRNLVLWNQSTDDAERSRYEGKLLLLRKCRRLMPHLRERIERFRQEITGFLHSDFTPEEASLLTEQLLPGK